MKHETAMATMKKFNSLTLEEERPGCGDPDPKSEPMLPQSFGLSPAPGHAIIQNKLHGPFHNTLILNYTIFTLDMKV